MKRKAVQERQQRHSEEELTRHPVLRKSNSDSTTKLSEHQMMQREYHQTRH